MPTNTRVDWSYVVALQHGVNSPPPHAPLLRLMLSLELAGDTAWSSVDITSAFLNADIHDEDVALLTPPPILVKMNITKPNAVWQVKN